MLVDDSIVVVENIVRHLEEKMKIAHKSSSNYKSNKWSLIWSNIINNHKSFSVFLNVFRNLNDVTIYLTNSVFAIASLLLSIIVAFSINPFISYILTKEKKIKHHEKKFQNLIQNLYLKILKNI